jgi:hypothetical protein
MQTHTKQLLRERLFPATTTDPKTAATFSVLEQFHLLSFESKVSAFEFYQGLSRLSDNVGIDPPKVSYNLIVAVCDDDARITESVCDIFAYRA